MGVLDEARGATGATGATVRADSDETLDIASGETVEATPGAKLPPPTERGAEHVELPPPFVFRRELSRGGMGRVLIAWDERHGREVAIKIVRGADPGLTARFAREAQVTARLQHPSIVPVYDSGKLADGEPFYVMRLVSGRSLDRVIVNRKLTARLALLPQLIAACDAIAYAHDRHVVHRDLKPQNILVGQFGETVVIDWGLAKDLIADAPAGPSPPPPTSLFEEPSEGASGPTSGLTVAGQIIGTPTYMPPEQARGVEVDERADVYALGAVLYHVLGGVAPYEARTVAEIIAEVLEGPPPPLAAREPHIPADLCAIVDKAMARDPRARYPSAAELAADLKKFQTGQLVGAHRYSLYDRVRRFTARQRAAVAVAVVLVAALVVVGSLGVRGIARERDVARARGDEAQVARAAAEQVVQYLIAELADRLQRFGRLDLLKGVGEAVVRYEESTARRLAEEAPSLRRAKALLLIAQAEGPRGDLATAERALRTSVEIYRRLAAAAPEDAALRTGLLAAERALVENILVKHAANAEAIAFTEREEALVREATSANDAQLVNEIAGALITIGRVREITSEKTVEERVLRGAIAAATRAAALAPHDPEPRRTLARAHEELADSLRRAGRLDECSAESARVVAIFDALAAEHPGDPRFLFELQKALRDDALVTSSRGNYKDALKATERGSRIAIDLARRDPENSDWLAAQVTHLDNRASISFDRGVYRDARRDYEELLRVIAGIKRVIPEIETHRSRGAQMLGWIELQEGRPAQAIPRLAESLAIEERLFAERPNDRIKELGLVEALSDLGYAELLSKRYDDAAGHLRRARDRISAFLQKNPTDREWRMRACFGYAWLGAALHRGGHQAEARAPLEQAVAIALLLADTTRPELDVDVSSAIAEASAFALEELRGEAPAAATTLLARIVPVLRAQVADGTLHHSAVTELPRWERILRGAGGRR